MSDKDTWVQIPTKHDSVGMRLSDLKRAQISNGPITRSEEQKEQVVASVMQKFYGSDPVCPEYDRNSFEEAILQNIKLKRSIKELTETTNSQISELKEKCAASDQKVAAFKSASSYYFRSRRVFIWITVVLLSICFFLGFTLKSQLKNADDLQSTIRELRERNSVLTSKITSLRQDNSKLTTSLTEAESLISDLRTKVSRSSSSSNYSYYVGNVNSLVFHRSTCSYLPDGNNRDVFFYRIEAIGEGYSPCSHCNP